MQGFPDVKEIEPELAVFPTSCARVLTIDAPAGPLFL
jgi:hypothetical protein